MNPAIGEARIRVPDQVVQGEVIVVNAIISHPMDTGFFRDADGQPIPAYFIKDVVVAYGAEEIARFWLAGAAAAYGQAKRLVRSQPSRTFAEQLSEEARSIGASFDTADAKARVAGFAAASAKRG